MVWIQYDISTGIKQSTMSRRVDDKELEQKGRAQIEVPDGTNLSGKMIDPASKALVDAPLVALSDLDQFIQDWPHEKIIEYLADDSKLVGLKSVALAVKLGG